MIRRWFLLPLVSGVILVLDQWTKSLVVTNLHLGEAWAPFPQFAGFFDIAHWMNTGAAFGLFPQLGGVFTIVAFVVSIGIVWYYHGLEANAAGVLFDSWGDSVGRREIVTRVAPVAEYRPGQFYRRELPCLLALLELVKEPVELLIVDGYAGRSRL